MAGKSSAPWKIQRRRTLCAGALLSSITEQDGDRVDVGLAADDINILMATNIPPLPLDVLRRTPDLKLATGN
jgi:hypothetical protein